MPEIPEEIADFEVGGVKVVPVLVGFAVGFSVAMAASIVIDQIKARRAAEQRAALGGYDPGSWGSPAPVVRVPCPCQQAKTAEQVVSEVAHASAEAASLTWNEGFNGTQQENLVPVYDQIRGETVYVPAPEGEIPADGE